MKSIISIRDLSFSYKEREVFKDFSFDIAPQKWVSIVGPNGSGKSTLIKLIVGLISGFGIIEVDGLIMNSNNLMSIRERIGIVFSNPDNTFVAETVADELAFPLENLEYESDIIKKRIDDVSKKLKITNILEKEPHRLSGGEKQLVALGVALITNPKVLILDEALCMLDSKNKKRITEILKKLREEGMTIINITHNLEETVSSDRILVIRAGKKVIEGPTANVYKEERLLSRLGLTLPFMVDLSSKLEFYGLVDKQYLDMKEMVDVLWK